MSKDDGGTAFPNFTQYSDGFLVQKNPGMSLRDYFAAKAMQGFVTDTNYRDEGREKMVAEAYRVADAMLKARKA